MILACLQIHRKLLSLATFLRVPDKISYLSWQNTYPNLKNTCHIKLNFFLWTKILENFQISPWKISHICRWTFKNKSVTFCLTDFYFHRTACRSRNTWRNLTVNQYFRPAVRMSPKLRKTGYRKVTAAVLIFYFSGLLIVIFRRIKCNEE